MFPRTSEAVEIVSKAASSIFFFLTNKEKGDLKGYMLLPEAEKSGFHVREMWNVNIPHSQQTITNLGKYIKAGYWGRGVVLNKVSYGEVPPLPPSHTKLYPKLYPTPTPFTYQMVPLAKNFQIPVCSSISCNRLLSLYRQKVLVVVYTVRNQTVAIKPEKIQTWLGFEPMTSALLV